MMDHKNFLYFWEPEGEVEISEETWGWLEEIKLAFQETLTTQELGESNSFVMELLCTLEDMEETYRNLYFFSRTFFQFVLSAEDRNVRAAVTLLKKLIEQHRGEAEVLAKACWPWDYRTTGRMIIKRYVALLGNDVLRQKVLGF